MTTLKKFLGAAKETIHKIKKKLKNERIHVNHLSDGVNTKNIYVKNSNNSKGKKYD